MCESGHFFDTTSCTCEKDCGNLQYLDLHGNCVSPPANTTCPFQQVFDLNLGHCIKIPTICPDDWSWDVATGACKW